jgi:hypothetical protein
MASKSRAGEALKMFVLELGVPEELTINGSKEQTKPNTDFMKVAPRTTSVHTGLSAGATESNPAEGVIWEVRRQQFRTMMRKRVPKKLWDHGV